MTDQGDTTRHEEAPDDSQEALEKEHPTPAGSPASLLGRAPGWARPVAIAVVAILVVGALWWVFVLLPQQQLQTAREQYAQGLYAEAGATLNAILQRDGRNRDALLELARVKAATGDSAGALALYARVIGAGGGSAAVLFEMAQLERLVGRTLPAIGHFRAAWQQDGENVKYADELGKTLVSAGQAKQAGDLWVGLANEASRPAAERKSLYVEAALAYREGGNKAEARAALQKALLLVPKDTYLKDLLKSVQ